MTTLIIFSTIYLAGVVLCYQMLRVEHESEKRTLTIGERIIGWLLSLLSWKMVITMLVRSWVNQISKTGYWDRPVKKTGGTKKKQSE